MLSLLRSFSFCASETESQTSSSSASSGAVSYGLLALAVLSVVGFVVALIALIYVYRQKRPKLSKQISPYATMRRRPFRSVRNPIFERQDSFSPFQSSGATWPRDNEHPSHSLQSKVSQGTLSTTRTEPPEPQAQPTQPETEPQPQQARPRMIPARVRRSRHAMTQNWAYQCFPGQRQESQDSSFDTRATYYGSEESAMFPYEDLGQFDPQFPSVTERSESQERSLSVSEHRSAQ